MADPALSDPSVRAFLGGVASAGDGTGGGAGGNVVPMPPPKQGGDPVKEAVRQEWLAAGYPPAAVAGIMRRVGDESGWKTQALGDYVNGQPTSLSLYQHHADRAVKLAQYLSENKVDVHDPVAMARATTRRAIEEMDGADPIAARSKAAMQNPQISEGEAYGLFTRSFERPATSPGNEATNLHQQAAGSFNGAAQSLLGTLQGDIARRGQELDAALAESKDLRSASRAQLAKWAVESDRPPKDMRENWAQWLPAASALALIGGMFGKNHTAAINAAGEMLQAANQADVTQYDRHYKSWKDHVDHGLKLVELLHGEARDIVEDARKSYDSKVSELQTLSVVYSLQQKLDPHSVENLSKNIELLRQRSDLIKAQNGDSDIRNAVTEKDEAWLKDHPEAGGKVPAGVHLEHEGDAKRTASGTSYKPGTPHQVEVVDQSGNVVRRGAAYSVAGGGMVWVGGGDVETPPGGTVNLKSTQQPKSASGLAVQRYLEENPNAGSADISQFNAEFTRLGALDRDFASGPDGRNLISLNTVADHIPLFRKYAAALSNGTTQAANAALNEIQRQLGRPDITNFDLARDFLADEVARVLVPGGAGALADREAMKDRLKSSMSPQQLAGGADTATNFIKGKLEALRQQYGRGDEKRESYFNTKMLTPGAREMFGQQQPTTGKHHVGEVIEHGGKRYRVTGGDMNDPDVEEVR